MNNDHAITAANSNGNNLKVVIILRLIFGSSKDDSTHECVTTVRHSPRTCKTSNQKILAFSTTKKTLHSKESYISPSILQLDPFSDGAGRFAPRELSPVQERHGNLHYMAGESCQNLRLYSL